jgi:cytochrome P450
LILNDEKHWQKFLEFIPERFLENGKYLSSRPSAFIPFGLGHRVCLGEKLALAHSFLVSVRFLQATDGYEIALKNGPQNWSLELF